MWHTVTRRVSKGLPIAAVAFMVTGIAGLTHAQTPPNATTLAAKPTIIVTPHAPVARQVEPLVPPVKRVKPNAVAATPTARKSSPVAAAVASPSPAVPANANSLAPDAAKAATTAPPPPAVAKTAPTNSLTIHSAHAVVAHPPTKQKVTATACKLGEAPSAVSKPCVVPGVAKVASTKPVRAKKTTQAQAKTPLDLTGRSALGATPKR